jgi:cold shock CspA family protein
MVQAVIKRFVAEKHHGFLQNPESGGKDIFFAPVGNVAHLL